MQSVDDNSVESVSKAANRESVMARLWAPCDAASVVWFRIFFALGMLMHLAVYFGIIHDTNMVEYHFGLPQHHMSFFGFEWVKALGLDGMRRVYYLMGLAAIGVGLGLLYRASAIVLFVTFTYALLAEASQFQNHYYLMCLLAFLMILIPAHRSFSIDALLFPGKACSSVPNWCRWILMFQIAVPYFYGGIAKIDLDWLSGIPVGMLISEESDLPLIGPLLTERFTAVFITYAGLFFDLLIVPMLLWRRTRLWAFAAAVLFHITNSVLFSIDVFPWMMIFVTPILFPADWPRKLFRLPGRLAREECGIAVSTGGRWLIGLLAVFVTWQVLFPFRHVLYPGDPSWTEEGQDFAWRMMLRRKDVLSYIYAIDGPSGRAVYVPVPRLMTYKQAVRMSTSPDQLVACAPFFAQKAREQGMRDVEIRALVLTSLNGRKPQLQIDPDLNLLTVKRSLWHQRGIIPLTEPRRSELWDVPMDDWPEAVGVEPLVKLPVRQ